MSVCIWKNVSFVYGKMSTLYGKMSICIWKNVSLIDEEE